MSQGSLASRTTNAGSLPSPVGWPPVTSYGRAGRVAAAKMSALARGTALVSSAR